MKINNAVICAAGMGSRLGLDTPKCLVELNNRPLIYYLLQILEDVANVRVVVGFKEEEVINCVKAIRSDVVFVRNPDYRVTTNSYSLHLGSRDFSEPFLNIDGDMYIDKKNYELFKNSVTEGEDIIGVTKSYTEDAVYTRINENFEVDQFSRNPISEFEWTGIAYIANASISKEGKYVYQELEPYLPIKACLIECFEIDTPKDLENLYQRMNL